MAMQQSSEASKSDRSRSGLHSWDDAHKLKEQRARIGESGEDTSDGPMEQQQAQEQSPQPGRQVE